jgi:flagellin-like hook-associated protein FlgL
MQEGMMETEIADILEDIEAAQNSIDEAMYKCKAATVTLGSTLKRLQAVNAELDKLQRELAAAVED